MLCAVQFAAPRILAEENPAGREMKMPHVEATAEVPVGADALWREIGSFQALAAGIRY